MASNKIEMALAFVKSQPAAAAGILEGLGVERVSEFLQQVPATHARVVLEKMLPNYIARLLQYLEPALAAGLVAQMDASQVAAILRYCAKDLRRKIIDGLPERTKIGCMLFLKYSEQEVGAWMKVNITTLPDACTAQEALQRLAAIPDNFNIGVLPVIDRDRLLVGMVNLGALLRSAPHTAVASMMDNRPASIPGRTALVSASHHSAWASRDVVVVTDRKGRLVGLLPHSDLRRGLGQLSNSIAQPAGSDPISGICAVYGYSLLTLLSTIGGLVSSRGVHGELK